MDMRDMIYSPYRSRFGEKNALSVQTKTFAIQSNSNNSAQFNLKYY